MATITANPSLQLTRFTSVYKFYDGRHSGTVNARRACFHATRGSPNIRLLTSIKGGSHTSRLMGSGQHNHLVARCSGGDSSDTTESSGLEMPSDSSDIEADISTVNSLESDGKVTQTKVDSAITEALEGEKVDNSSIQQSSNAVAMENGASKGEVYPSGDMVYKKKEGWEEFVVKWRMLFTLPWQRVKKGSVLTIKLSGEIAEQYQGRFMQGLSLPQICENLIKAAHDPRIEGVVISIEPLACGWGKLDEIRRHMEYYKQSGM